MIYDSILKAKRDELTNCITSRKRKLQELYHATVSFEPSHSYNQHGVAAHHHDSETRFLEANNISEGRFFDVSTLQLIHLDSTAHSSSSPVRLITKSASTEVRQNEPTIFDRKESPVKGESTTLISSQSIAAGNNDSSDSRFRFWKLVDGDIGSPSTSSKATQADLVPASATADIASGQATETSLLNTSLQGHVEQKDASLNGERRYQHHPVDSTVNTGISSSEAKKPSKDGLVALDPPEIVVPNLKDAQTLTKPDGSSTNGFQKPHSQQSHQIQTSGTTRSSPGVNPIGVSSSPINLSNGVLGCDNRHFVQDYVAETSAIVVNKIAKSESQISRHTSEVKDRGNLDEQRDLEKSYDDASQIKVNSSRSPIRAPSTPDAQLKFEEAQSMNASEYHHIPLAPIQGIPIPTPHQSGDIHSTLGQQARLDFDEYPRKISKDSQTMDIHHTERSSNDKHQILKDRRAPVSLERRLPGTTRDTSKDLMLSQRPPMRIDTAVVSSDVRRDALENAPMQSQENPNEGDSSSTPVRATTGPMHSSPPERMTTRVSSGALRHKSVSEILGGTPKSSMHTGDRSPFDNGSSDPQKDDSRPQTPGYGSLVMSPDSMSFRSRLSELREREKERSKLSTVVFARQQPADILGSTDGYVGSLANTQSSTYESKDYLLSLFTAQASSQSPALNALLGSAHKTLTTSNHYLDFHEQQDCRIMKRIYQLQNSNRWSLRQLERSIEPQRPISHWDALLGHAKWMRADFREERKWKLTTAKNLVDWCAEWVLSPADRRASLQVRIRKSTRSISVGNKVQSTDTVKAANLADSDRGSLHSDNPPELISSAGDDSSDAVDEILSYAEVTRAEGPAALFSLAPEDVLFSFDKTAVSDKLLSELPLYQPWKSPEDTSLHPSHNASDLSWKLPVVPISKFAVGKMIIREEGPAQKKSRFNYAQIDADQHGILGPPFFAPDHTADPLPPEQDNVGLFNLDFKQIRDRIHAGHAFRPPSEHVMPSQSFFECRQSSQWTWPEDDELRRIVREYAYNWSLISSDLSSPSLFSSGAERRTPWECFERWVALESLPQEMVKTQYFKAYHARQEAAQQTLMAQQQAAQAAQAQQAQQGQQGTNTSQGPIRRKTSMPVRVDRRRNNKHLSLLHAMQKLAKKKEVAIQKQQHAAQIAAMRKANEATQPRQAMRTPREFSRFKHERESKLQERQDAYRLQVLAQQRASQVQKTNQQASQQQGGSNLPQPSRNPISGNLNGSSPRLISHPSQFPNSNRGLPLSQSSGNGIHQSVPQVQNAHIGARGVVPQAQMQSSIPGQQRMQSQITNDMRIYMEANRQQEQQRYLQQQQQRQQHQSQPNNHNGASSPPSSSNLNGTSQINSAAVLANFQATNGISSPAHNGGSGALSGTSVSPRLANPMQAQGLSSGMVPAVNTISREIKLRHPQASPEQVSKMTTDSLNQYRMSHSQAAMAAAVGNSASNNLNTGLQVPMQQQAMMNGVSSSPMMNPAMYTQMMRSQQPAPPNRNGSSSVNGTRPPSRSATPLVHRNSNGPVGPSQSPRPPRAQMAGVQ